MTFAPSTRAILAPDPVVPVQPASAKPSFSCIVAAYQVADLVGRSIQSILDQSYPAHEVIVVDDGSTDDIEGAVGRFGDKVKFLRRGHKGAAAAMNAGVAEATGDYVCFIGADDEWSSERLEALAELAVARPDLDILTTDAWVAVQGQAFRRLYDDTNPFEVANQRQGILERCFVFGHTAVPRKRFHEIGGFEESIHRTSDWDLWARLILGGSSIGIVNEPLATYHVHDRALSSSRLDQTRGRLLTLQRMLAHPSLSASEREFVERYVASTRREIEWGDTKLALLDGSSGVRARAWRVFADPGQPRIVRARALVTAIAPWVPRRSLLRQQQRYYVGAGGVRVPRS
jgi:glycosyltransferase involved in cell wall biosynthesis